MDVNSVNVNVNVSVNVSVDEMGSRYGLKRAEARAVLHLEALDEAGGVDVRVRVEVVAGEMVGVLCDERDPARC